MAAAQVDKGGIAIQLAESGFPVPINIRVTSSNKRWAGHYGR